LVGGVRVLGLGESLVLGRQMRQEQRSTTTTTTTAPTLVVRQRHSRVEDERDREILHWISRFRFVDAATLAQRFRRLEGEGERAPATA